jgi:hypothetical protein
MRQVRQDAACKAKPSKRTRRLKKTQRKQSSAPRSAENPASNVVSLLGLKKREGE